MIPFLAIHAFSGAGNTWYAAEIFAAEAGILGLKWTLEDIDLPFLSEMPVKRDRKCLMVLPYPIYGGGASWGVHKWLK